ncbi:hypothetical protein [Streptomyces griseorubiginosus]
MNDHADLHTLTAAYALPEHELPLIEKPAAMKSRVLDLLSVTPQL